MAGVSVTRSGWRDAEEHMEERRMWDAIVTCNCVLCTVDEGDSILSRGMSSCREQLHSYQRQRQCELVTTSSKDC